MKSGTLRVCVLVACFAGLGVGSAWAQPERGAQPESGTQPRAALAGPEITKGQTPSLVEWRYDGSLRELESSPEEVALSLLELDADVRARADAVIARRQAFFDRVLSRNLMLALEIDAAQKAEEKLRTARLTFELLAHFEPLKHEPSLREAIAAELDAEDARTFESMIDAYDLAFAQDLGAKASREGRRTNRVEIIATRAGQQFVRDLEMSFKRMESSGQIAFEYVLAQLSLESEQAERVRKACSPFLGANPDGMTEKEYGLAFLAMAAHLTETQRAKLAEIIAGF
jgi:hypothetical protein